MALKPLTLEQLIAAPLRAIVMGQEAAAQATAEFVSEVGFEAKAGGSPTVRMVEFDYLHPLPDPENPGSVIPTPTRVRVPLLTMVPVPNMRVAEATIAFSADIVDAEPAPKLKPSSALRREAIERIASPKLIARYAPGGAVPGRTAATLNVTIKLIKERPAEGLTRMINLLSDAITAVPEKERSGK